MSIPGNFNYTNYREMLYCICRNNKIYLLPAKFVYTCRLYIINFVSYSMLLNRWFIYSVMLQMCLCIIPVFCIHLLYTQCKLTGEIKPAYTC